MDLRLWTSGRLVLRGAIAGLIITSTPALAIPDPNESDLNGANPGATSLLVFTNAASEDDSGGFGNLGRPRRRSSGGSRGICADLLVALVPGVGTLAQSDQNCSLQSASTLALTVDETPTLWFHAPEQDQANRAAELVLLDDNQQAISIERFILPQASGIVGVQLSQPLATNQSYQWVFSILENQRNPSQNPAVEGVLRRVAPDANLEMALLSADTQRKRVDVFAQNGIWHDALTELVNLRRTAPNNPAVARDWASFLNSVDLSAIADAPLLNCCTDTLL
ncbi:MAG: DUF928 domain-containing protein [Leptolyngbyaceae cyanobacterium MO_188.B28]|nr:DUF928 domain-containing protein [Leptolyngbyaceae cyanobacterium MO_188.B28]